eukprot:GHVU01206375.1.p1 GENE.GHVU01206375.1~~GHVU01206375.1.p1  ORF type:complete len:162 (-),score=5.20 GHVU01206375.1:145-630(-)
MGEADQEREGWTLRTGVLEAAPFISLNECGRWLHVVVVTTTTGSSSIHGSWLVGSGAGGPSIRMVVLVCLGLSRPRCHDDDSLYFPSPLTISRLRLFFCRSFNLISCWTNFCSSTVLSAVSCCCFYLADERGCSLVRGTACSSALQAHMKAGGRCGAHIRT